jgi:hypothetical protein
LADKDLVESIQKLVRNKKYLYTIHAGDRMTERRISVEKVEQALQSDLLEIIEDYPDDPRGPSCLALGATENGKLLHIHCTHPPGLAVITAYEPDEREWENGFRKRTGG